MTYGSPDFKQEIIYFESYPNAVQLQYFNQGP